MAEKEITNEQQEIFLKLSFFEQQIKNLQQQLQAIEEAIIELSNLDFGLDEIKNSKGKEILASIGRGIYLKTKLESEELLVDVGEKKFVKKNIDETKNLIKEQLNKLEEVREQINNNLQEIDEKINETISGEKIN